MTSLYRFISIRPPVFKHEPFYTLVGISAMPCIIPTKINSYQCCNRPRHTEEIFHLGSINYTVGRRKYLSRHVSFKFEVDLRWDERRPKLAKYVKREAAEMSYRKLQISSRKNYACSKLQFCF